ncbi:transglutaminase domain-containing protein [Flaviaesturariibacter terrae]
MMRSILTTTLFVVLSGGFAAAQDWKQQFPDAQAVYTQVGCEVQIKNNGGKLTASTTYTEDMNFATAQAARMMGRGSIYHGSFSELKSWDAYTQSADRKKMKVANVSTESSRSDYVFYDDAKTTSFDFAGLSDGVSRHIEYTLTHSDLHLLSPFYLDRYFPVLNGTLKVEFPSNVQVKYLVRGINADKVQFAETRKRDKVTYTFTVNGNKGAAYYGDAPDNSWYATHIIFYIEKYEANGQWTNWLSDVNDLYKYNYNFIREVNSDPGIELKQITEGLVKDVTTEREKARRIYQWVQAHIKYVAFEDGMGGFVPRPAQLVCSRRFGDCKDMASILTSMLRIAGLKAYYTWIGTRHLPYRYSEVPLPIVDNHMICTVQIDDKYIFLDGTDSDCIFGFPSSHIQDKQALVSISENEYKLLTVETVPPEKNRCVDSTFLELGPEGLTGKLRVHLTGYLSDNMYGLLNYKNEKEREEYFRSRFNRGNNKIRFSNWKMTVSEDRNDSWVTADFVLPDYARKVGDEWIVNLNLMRPYEHEEIDFPKRNSPISYNFLASNEYSTVLKVPAGYKVSYLPEGEQFRNDVWGFELKYGQTKESLSLTQRFENHFMMLQPDQFERWNKVLEHLFPHFKQTVVLSK